MTDSHHKEATSQTVARRTPQQVRSRERMERILAAAKTLIARDGSDAMKMGELAEQAGVSIGSLYQYFPDKGAIVRTLAERYNLEGRACIREALEEVKDTDSLARAFRSLIDMYYGLFLAEPVMRDIWSGTQADKALLDIDLADSRENGAVLARVLQRLHPNADSTELLTTATLLMHLGTATMRLAIGVERSEGDGLVEAYVRIALRDLQAIT
ncbi:TetR family transcriptional regulator [Pleomorphomonas sp. PLEO]|uniref:TetR family transcriptional regulator n=1 Tax=Pleomorphomonas sp. PLEO TaxID=3239306 RepID=UPI00351EA4DE